MHYGHMWSHCVDCSNRFSETTLTLSPLRKDPLWSALLVKTQPQAIVDLHKQFYRSGADIVVTATYQASIEGYVKKFGMTQSEAADVVTEGINLAKQARHQMQSESGRKCWVAGSVGPYGATLCDMSEYHGKYAEKMTSQELTEWHSRRLAAIVKGQPDILAVETIPVVKEAEAILESLKSFPESRAWVSFQCKDEAHTGHGEKLSDAIRTSLQSDNVIAVGVNCTNANYITPLLKSLSHLDIKVPILVKPNKGGLSGEAPATTSLDEKAPEWIQHGATWLGGCCYYGPRDIASLRHFLDSQPELELSGPTL
ncbi:homocysteine S-methyltransferase YbgG-like isoform X2 [Littorina saxatilis]|uniref:homocysteine S-methyltransferase YbgG-like isoform X2 n=1 Tax=Littorina saxatilis TaxID=31220 RepID=UPI0038B5FFF7